MRDIKIPVVDSAFNIESVLRELGFVVELRDGVMQATGITVENLGDIWIQLHREFNFHGNREMCVLCSNHPHMDCLYMGLEPQTYGEFSTLFQLIFPASFLSYKVFSKYSYDYCKFFDQIHKYLHYKGDCYVPVIFKYENVFDESSIWIMYIKENRYSFSNKKVLFHVEAGSLEVGLSKFMSLYDDYCEKKFIKDDRCWYGDEPYGIDFLISHNGDRIIKKRN